MIIKDRKLDNFSDFQEPGHNASEISLTLRYVRPGMQQWVIDKGYPNGFIPRFPMMERADVSRFIASCHNG